MPWGIVLLILFAAALHASWNILLKSESESLTNTVLIVAGSAVIGVVFLPFVPLPLRPCWPYLGASVVIHIVYFTVLLLAYKKGDMSLVYPLMRGLPPVLTAIAASILLSEVLSLRGWLGIALVSGGALMLTADFRFSKGFQPAPVALAFLNAIVIVIYTLVDAQGARLSGNAFSYTGWMLFLLALFIFLAIPIIEGRQSILPDGKGLEKKPHRRRLYLRFLRNRALGDDAGACCPCGRPARDIDSLRHGIFRINPEGTY